MNANDIKAVYYNEEENKVVAVYVGNNLIYVNTESEEPEEPVYNPKLLKGKFTDDSMTFDWYWKPNNSSSEVSLVDYVNPTTKKFEYEYDGTLTSCAYMFGGNTYLERIDSIPDTSNSTNFNYLFSMCSSLTSINVKNLNTENGKDFGYTFGYCSSLTTLNLGNNFKMNNSTNIFGMFYNCTSLTTVTGTISGLKLALDLSYSPLTNESAMVFINGLEDVSSTKKLTFSSTTYDTLTEEQIAIATAKGWTVLRN